MAINEYDEIIKSGAPQVTTNEYDAIVKDQAGSQNTAIRGAMQVAASTTPDRAAQVIKLSERTKLPREIVERNFDVLSKKHNMSDNEYDAIVRENPKLSTWLSDPANASVAADDVPLLRRVENTFSAFGRGWSKASAQGRLADLLYHEVENGDLNPQDAAERDALKKKMQALDVGGGGVPEYIANVTGYSARQMGSSLEVGLKGAGAGGIAGAVAGSVLPGVGTVAGGSAGMLAGGLTASANYSYRLETGFAFDEIRSLKDVNGNPIDPKVARSAAKAVGAINSIIESGSDAMLATLVPGFGKLVSSATGKDQAKRALMNEVKATLAVPSRRAMILSALGKMGGAASVEGLEEFVQGLVGAGGREAAQAGSGQRFAPDSAIDDIDQAARSALDAAVGTFFTFSPVGGASYYVDSRKAAKAQQQQQFFQALGEGVSESKTFQRLPQKMQDFIEQATKDGPIDTVYVPVEQWATYWQSKNIDPAQVAAEVMGDTVMYESSIQTGADLAIPMSIYATKIAPTEHNGFFSAEVRLAPDEMNAREAAEFEQRMADEVKAAQADEAAAAVAEGRATPEQSAEAIRQDVIGQLVSSGYDRATAETYAATHAEMFKSIGIRYGIDPYEAYQKHGLKIARPMPDILKRKVQADDLDAIIDRMRSGTIPSDRSVYGESLVEFLRKRGGVVDDGGELAARDADKGLKPFQKRLANPKGMSLDTAREVARDAGYIGEDSTVADFIALIDNELSGSPVYAMGGEKTKQAEIANAAQQLGPYFSELGIDLNAMTNDQVREALRNAIGVQIENATEMSQEQLPEMVDVDGVQRPTRNSNGQQITATMDAMVAFWRWFGDSKVVDSQGRPMVVYHGTADDFSYFDLQHPNRKDVGWLGTGIYMTDSASLAGSYSLTKGGSADANIMPLYARVLNPYYAEKDEKQRIMLLSHNNKQRGIDAADARTKELKAAGHDGVIMRFTAEQVGEENVSQEIVVFDGASVKSATGNRGTFDPLSGNILHQSDVETDLIITHNVTAANLLHAMKLGGFPVPSLAITRAGESIDGFGEITLIGSKEMADPRGYAGTRVFGADIYSPRYPQVEYKFKDAKLKALGKELADGLKATAGQIDVDNMERRGVNELENNAAVMWEFLKSRGIEPKIVMERTVSDERIAELKAMGLEKFFPVAGKYYDKQQIARDPEFQRLSMDAEDFKKYDERQRINIAWRLLHEIEDIGKTPKADTRASMYAMRDQIRGGLDAEFTVFAEELFATLDADESIFRGYTDSGRRRYMDHTLENVVKILKKDFVGGESETNIYGMGQLRSKFAPQFKSVMQIKAASGRLVSDAEFEAVKKEVEAEFFALVDELKPAYESSINEFGFPDIVMAVIENTPKMGLDRAAKDMGFDPESIFDSTREQLREFITRLRNMPTEYFEAKILREVDLSEFAGAVVPEGVDPRVEEALRSRGVAIIHYAKGKNGDDVANRQAAVKSFAADLGDKVLFQPATDQTESTEFKAWAGDGFKFVESNEINSFDFGGDGPFVLRGFHGTTNTFNEFNASLKGNTEGQFGAVNYFTSSEQDATDNYAGEGPDLTQRIELKAERIADEIKDFYDEFDSDKKAVSAIKKKYGNDVYNEDMMVMARNIVRKELHGGDEKVLEVFIRTERPFIVGDVASPWFEFFDEAQLEADAIERVADNNGVEIDDVKSDYDKYGDEISDARYELMGEAGNPLTEAVQTVASRYDFDPSELLGSLYDIQGDGTVRHNTIEEYLRQNESLSYAYNPETGDNIQSHMIGEIIQELGFDSIILKNANVRFKNMNIEPGTAHIHVFDANNTNIKSVDNSGAFDINNPNIYAQKNGDKKPDVPRGRIRFGASRQFSIDLLEGADLSTFIHESGHFWLEVLGDMVDDLSRREPSTLTDQQVKMIADYQTLLNWFGVKDRSGITVEHHERFARGIEAYFMEGKAPSAELRSVMARVRAWMMSVYRSLKQLNVNLNPEVRGVFDRMFATDQQIEQAEAEGNVSTMFATAADAKMTDVEFAAYKARAETASRTAKERLGEQVMRTLTRERLAWWKEERAKVRAEVADEVNKQPEQIALSVLTKGTMPDGSEIPDGVPAFKLSRKEIDAVYGEGAWKTLPRGATAADGMALQTAAEVLGFTSGDDLIRGIRAARPAKALIEAETDVRMREMHGDPLVDGGIADQARAAVHNDDRSKVIEAELRALRKMQRESAPAVAAERKAEAQRVSQGQDVIASAVPTEQRSGRIKTKDGRWINWTGQVPTLASFKRIAAGQIGQMRVRDIRPLQYLTAARKASDAALKAAASKDYLTAANNKQRELLNIELYKAAQAAVDEVAETVDYMQKFGKASTRARIGKAGQDYLDQIDGFLDRYDFARVPLKSLERRRALQAWIAEKEKAGEPVNLPDDVVVETRVNYKDITIDELRGVRDSVKHIEHLARLKNRLLKSRAKQALDEAIADIVESIENNAKSVRGRKIETRLPGDEALRLIDSGFGLHRKLSSVIREIDGLKDGGTMWDYIMRPINEAGDAEAVMNKDATERFKKLFDAYKGKDIAALYAKQRIDAIDGSLTKMARLMVALNWGNADNRQKLMDGYGWTDVQVESILADLDERDWNFVQGVWDMIDSYWPEIAASARRIEGIAPDKVEAMPIQTKFGEFKGGYFPLKYDDRQSIRAYSNRAKEAAERAMKGASMRSSSKSGSRKERVSGVKLPVRLDFGVMFEHVSEVIHDLSHTEMLIDINRLLGSKEVSDKLIEVYGDVRFKQMQQAIEDIAGGNIAAVGAFEKSINYVRTGMTVAGLGWNVMTAMLQPIGLTQSMSKVGVKWVMRGLGRWMSDAAQMENTAAWIKEKSPMMRSRMDTQMREINEIRQQVGLNTGKLTGWIDQALRTVTMDKVHKQAVADSFFWLIYKGQQIADIPTWIGAYEKALEQGNDDARAVALADQEVLDSQGGGQIKDLAGIQRGGPLLKIWTSFYSYFNVTYNLNVEAVKRTSFKNPIEIGRLAVDLLLLNTLPATLGYLMKHALVGNDDDDDKFWTGMIRENVSYMFGLMIGLREFGSVIQGYQGYSGPAGVRFFSEVAKLMKQIEQGEVDGAFWKALNGTAGILLHYPAGQVRRTVEGFNAIVEGQTKNPVALLVGPPKE